MDKQKLIEEMECFNCIHADVCAVQKGGVNLQLVDSMGCGYHQPKLPEGSVVLTKEDYLRMVVKEEAIAIAKPMVNQARTQAVKEFAERLKKEKMLIDLGCGDGCYEYIDIEDIDNTAKEMGVEL